MKKCLLPVAIALFLSACGTAGPGKVNPPVAGQSSSTSTESLETLTTRAKSGNADAMFQLGAMYHDGQLVKQDFATAMDWFGKAAAKGDERAQFNLGVMYYIGEGVKQNYAKAQSWFEAAAKQKNARAQFNLGVMYYRAEGVKQNYAQALSYFAESGSQGFAEAEYNLGVMYAKGEGVSQDIGKAYAWFTAAKAYGSTKSDQAIANIEKALSADQLKLVKSMAVELKTGIDKNVAALKLKAGKM